MNFKSNKGFSYIEVMIVLGIASIIVAFSSISIGLVSRSNINKAGDKLTSAISEARMVSMTKGEEKGKIVISFSNGNYYYTIDGQTKKFASNPITISVLADDGSVLETVTASHSVTIKFNRNTGGVNNSNPYNTYGKLKIGNNTKSVDYKIYRVTGRFVLE